MGEDCSSRSSLRVIELASLAGDATCTRFLEEASADGSRMAFFRGRRVELVSIFALRGEVRADFRLLHFFQLRGGTSKLEFLVELRLFHGDDLGHARVFDHRSEGRGFVDVVGGIAIASDGESERC